MRELTREQVQRYLCKPGIYDLKISDYRPIMTPSDTGDWVAYENYAALRAQLAASQQRVRELETQLSLISRTQLFEDTCKQLTEAQATIARLHDLCESNNKAFVTLLDGRDQLQATVTAQGERISRLSEAVGLATTCAPSMEMDTNHPVEMMQQVCAAFTNMQLQLTAQGEEIGRLRASIEKLLTFKKMWEQARRDECK